MAIETTFEEYAQAVYARSLLDNMSNVDEVSNEIIKKVKEFREICAGNILGVKYEPVLTPEILNTSGPSTNIEAIEKIAPTTLDKYTKSQIGQAIANLKRAKHAGKQLERKQKAYKRKANE